MQQKYIVWKLSNRALKYIVSTFNKAQRKKLFLFCAVSRPQQQEQMNPAQHQFTNNILCEHNHTDIDVFGN